MTCVCVSSVRNDNLSKLDNWSKLRGKRFGQSCRRHLSYVSLFFSYVYLISDITSQESINNELFNKSPSNTFYKWGVTITFNPLKTKHCIIEVNRCIIFISKTITNICSCCGNFRITCTLHSKKGI